jgi:hypothetical protein
MSSNGKMADTKPLTASDLPMSYVLLDEFAPSDVVAPNSSPIGKRCPSCGNE